MGLRNFGKNQIFDGWPQMVGNMLKRILEKYFSRKMKNEKFPLRGNFKYGKYLRFRPQMVADMLKRALEKGFCEK